LPRRLSLVRTRNAALFALERRRERALVRGPGLWRLDPGVLINSDEKTHLRFTDVSTAWRHYNPTNVASCGRDAVGAAR
jgi:hypothetical protein